MVSGSIFFYLPLDPDILIEFFEKQPTEGIGVAICYPDTLNITADGK